MAKAAALVNSRVQENQSPFLPQYALFCQIMVGRSICQRAPCLFRLLVYLLCDISGTTGLTLQPKSYCQLNNVLGKFL